MLDELLRLDHPNYSRYLLRLSDDPYRQTIFFDAMAKTNKYVAFKTYKNWLRATLMMHRYHDGTGFREEIIRRQMAVLRDLAVHAYEKHEVGYYLAVFLPEVVNRMQDYIPEGFSTVSFNDVDRYESWMNLLEQCSDEDDCRSGLRDRLEISDCDHCGNTFSNDDMDVINGDYICNSCRDDRYTWSEYEDAWIDNDDVTDAIDEYGNSVTVSCNNPHFRWDDETDSYVHEDYESPSRNRSASNIIRDYHSSRNRFTPKNDAWVSRHHYHMGVELEVEAVSVDRGEAAYRIHQAVNEDGDYGDRMFFERDGSLSDGFEMITQPMSLPALAETFKFLENPEAIQGLRSHMTRTCGLHVHVSKRGLTNLQINKIVAFINDPKHEWLIRAVARRYSTGFCSIKSKKIGHLHYRQDDRYEAVNVQGSRTIEFRIFKGSLKYRSVMAALEFCHALIQFCRPAEAGIHDLTAEKFLIFCRNKMRKETSNLLGFLDARLPGHKKAA